METPINTNAMAGQLGDDLGRTSSPQIGANIFLDDILLSTGYVIPGTGGQDWHFYPIDGACNLENCPASGAMLRLKGTNDAMRMKDFQNCLPQDGQKHYHFRVVESA